MQQDETILPAMQDLTSGMPHPSLQGAFAQTHCPFSQKEPPVCWCPPTHWVLGEQRPGFGGGHVGPPPEPPVPEPPAPEPPLPPTTFELHAISAVTISARDQQRFSSF